jgi:hypothetical protein
MYLVVPLPVTVPEKGKFWYVVADIVVAHKPPLTVNPVKVLKLTLVVPAKLFVKVIVLLEYEAPVRYVKVPAVKVVVSFLVKVRIPLVGVYDNKDTPVPLCDGRL